MSVTPQFGWIPHGQRTPMQAAYSAAAVAEMPPFFIRDTGIRRRDSNRCVLWDCSKAINKGEHFTVFYQKTGSCVGNGGGQAVWYLSAVEVVRRGDPEQVLLPFYLLPYGRSRFYMGDRGPGEGSTGSAFAKAIREDGIIPANTEGLPQPTNEGGITWGSSVEMKWSNGAAIEEKWLAMSRKHPVKTTAQCRSAADVRAALQNYYPCTIASNWGGRMQCQVTGTPAVLLNERAGTWNHQMCIIGWQKHPELGDLYYILNSWGVNAHGKPPDDAPPGGFWVREREIEYIVRQEETYAFSQFDGFPAQDISWYL